MRYTIGCRTKSSDGSKYIECLPYVIMNTFYFCDMDSLLKKKNGFTSFLLDDVKEAEILLKEIAQAFRKNNDRDMKLFLLRVDTPKFPFKVSQEKGKTDIHYCDKRRKNKKVTLCGLINK